MRLLYRSPLLIAMTCLLAGCCHLCDVCCRQEPLPAADAAVRETHVIPPSLYTVSDEYTYEHDSDVSGTERETFLVIDTSNVDPPPVRSTPKTFINVPVSRFHRNAPADTATVYFDLNSHLIRKTEMEKLEHFARRHKGATVSVTGYTCWRGTRKYNDMIAMKRSCAVAGYLRKRGVVVRSVNGKGKSGYASRTDIDLNRRAVITPCTEKSS